MKSTFLAFSVALLSAVCLGQTAPSSSEGTPQAPVTSPSTIQAPAPEATLPPNATEPKTMQPGAPPPIAPQNSGTSSSNPATPNATPSSASANQSPRLVPGSVIPVQLTKTVDAKKAKQGDEVHAKVTMDLKTNTGEVIVPKDTEVVGHVTEAQARNKEQKESQLAIVFDRADMKSGAMQLPMSIQAVIGPQNNSNNSSADQSAPAGPSAMPSPANTGASGRSPMGSAAPQSSPQPQAGAPESSSGPSDQPQANARPQITGKTQGVIGIANLKLESGQSAAQGSVLSSEKNNVKLESGTFMLLRVNQ